MKVACNISIMLITFVQPNLEVETKDNYQAMVPTWSERLNKLHRHIKQYTNKLTEKLQGPSRQYDTCNMLCQRHEFFIPEKQLMEILYNDRARRRSQPVKSNYTRIYNGRREINIGVCRGSCNGDDQTEISSKLRNVRGMNVKGCFAYKFVDLKVLAISEFEKEIKYKNIIIDKDGGCKCDSINTCG